MGNEDAVKKALAEAEADIVRLESALSKIEIELSNKRGFRDGIAASLTLQDTIPQQKHTISDSVNDKPNVRKIKRGSDLEKSYNLLVNHGSPMKFEEIADALKLDGQDRRELRRTLIINHDKKRFFRVGSDFKIGLIEWDEK